MSVGYSLLVHKKTEHIAPIQHWSIAPFITHDRTAEPISLVGGQVYELRFDWLCPLETETESMFHLHRPCRRRLRWLTSIAVVSGITATLFAVAVPAGADDTAQNSPGPLQQAEIDASAQARSTGQPVPVDYATDAYSTLVAQPDGSFSQDIAASPQRVKQNGSWVPLNPTLHRNSDGTYSTNATTAELTVSGGGLVPLASMNDGGKQLAFTWPTALPTPTVTGSTALYADVFPDVDLSVQANAQGGFIDIIIVKTAQAAQNPALGTLKMATSATGVTLTADSAGNQLATDAAENLIFHAAAPEMWDSTTDATGQPSGTALSTLDAPPSDAGGGSTDPTPGAQTATVAVQVQGDSVSITPSASLLTGASTTYPVYIDPGYTPIWVPGTSTSADYTYIQEGHPSTSNWDRDDSNDAKGIGVGYQGWESPYGIERSLYQFNIGTWIDSDAISTATLNVDETYTASFGCTNYNVSAYSMASHISSSTTWANFNNPTHTVLDTAGIGGAYNTGCPGVFPSVFNVKPALVDDTDGVITLELTGNESSDARDEFKRFAKSAKLVFTYDTTPTVPVNTRALPAPQTTPGTTTQGCNSSGPWGWIPNGASGGYVTLAGTVADPDAAHSQLVRGQFALWDDSNGASSIISMGSTDSIADSGWQTSGSTATQRIPVGDLTDGHLYGWQIRSDDGIRQSAGAASCHFRYDASAPTSISINGTGTTSGTCTDGGTLGQAGASLTFSFAAADSGSGVHHFDWTLGSASDLAGDGGTRTSAGAQNPQITFTTSWGSYYLNVAAVDNAGNESGAVCYSFYISDNPTQHVTPGDISGDGFPDLAAVPTSNFQGPQCLNYYTTNTVNAMAVVASDASNGPNADGTWAGAVTAHRSTLSRSSSGVKTDDLWALSSDKQHLYMYANNVYKGGIVAHANQYYSSDTRAEVARPVCDSALTSCTSYSTDWSGVQQIIAPGDMNGDGIPDLVTEEAGNQLWFFPGSTISNKFGSPQTIGNGGWDSYTLIAPGNTASDNGVAQVWARRSSTGDIYQYVTSYDSSTGKVTLAPQALIGGGYPATAYPLVISVGDVSGDGAPDLIATNADGKLVEQTGTTATSTTEFNGTADGPNPPAQIGSGGWRTISDIS